MAPPSPVQDIETDLGPPGPFPRSTLAHQLDRRWLHYAFRTPEGDLSLVANLSILGPSSTLGRSQDATHIDPQEMSILLVHDDAGWSSTQFNADVQGTPWSAFRLPDPGPRLRIGGKSGTPAVDLALTRTGHPCTSQCAPFAADQHLRWQSEPGVIACGTLTGSGGKHRDVTMLGYHERVRGHWAWPDLGGWVFGFANAAGKPGEPPPYAVVFTLIQPPQPADAATGSVMLWRNGRLLRHFPRRTLKVVVAGLLSRDRVAVAPPLARTLGTPPTAYVPRHLTITASTASDTLTIEVESTTACRIVNPNERGMEAFSVHEVLGPGRITGSVAGVDVDFSAPAVVEFAGGANVD
jgi:hypothetical protein